MEVMHLSGTIAIGLIILLHPVIAFAHGVEIGESELSEKDVIPTSNLPKITKEEKETMYETDALMEDEEGHYEDEEYHDELSMFDSWTSKTTSGIVRYSLTPSPMSDAGAKLGGFLIDILEVTSHMEVHLVTRGLIVQGLDTVCSMLMSRRIKIELYPNLLKFLTHLGPIEGYLSENQFIVYGSSEDIIAIIKQRRAVMDVINIGITTWYYVVLDNAISNDVIAETLEEASISILLRPSLYRPEDWVASTLISDGDGTRYFDVIGKWTKTAGLVVTEELFPGKSSNFMGRNLIIGIINKKRVLSIVNRGSDGDSPVRMRGYSKDILDILQKHLNFTIRTREYHTWGIPNDRREWNGVIGSLIRKEIDFSPMDFTPTMESREVIDFSEWVSEDPVVITSSAPHPIIRPFLLLEIFTPSFYLLLTGILFTSGVLLWLFVQLNLIYLPGYYPLPRTHKLFSTVRTVAKTIVSQCIYSPPSEFSSRIFLVSVWYAAFIIIAVYQGNITAFMAIPRYSKAVDNHLDLNDNKHLIPVTEEFTTTQTMVMDTNVESMRDIASRLEVYDAAFLSSEEFFQGVAAEKWVYIDTRSSAYGRALDYERSRYGCRFHVSRDIVTGGLDAWPFPRNSPVHAQISRAVKWLRYYGILEHIKGNYYTSKCHEQAGPKIVHGPDKMGLNEMQGVFYLLCLGWMFGALVFITEVIFRKMQHFWE